MYYGDYGDRSRTMRDEPAENRRIGCAIAGFDA
jgi:hypothetical protein